MTDQEKDELIARLDSSIEASCQKAEERCRELEKQIDNKRLFPGLKCAAIPWSVIAPHEQQAKRNHTQTLGRLAERGGLALCEMAAVLEDRPWRKMTDADAKAVVERFVNQAQEKRIAALEDRCRELEESIRIADAAAMAALERNAEMETIIEAREALFENSMCNELDDSYARAKNHIAELEATVERLTLEYAEQEKGWIEQIGRLTRELTAFRKLCPSCDGFGYFYDEEENAALVCDCASGIRMKYERFTAAAECIAGENVKLREMLSECDEVLEAEHYMDLHKDVSILLNHAWKGWKAENAITKEKP